MHVKTRTELIFCLQDMSYRDNETNGDKKCEGMVHQSWKKWIFGCCKNANLDLISRRQLVKLKWFMKIFHSYFNRAIHSCSLKNREWEKKGLPISLIHFGTLTRKETQIRLRSFELIILGVTILQQMIKAPPLISSDLHFSVL